MKKRSTEENKNNFQIGTLGKSMLIFTDGSAQGNLDSTRSVAVTKKQGLKNVAI